MTNRDRIIDLAYKAQDTPIAAQLTDYQALLTLVALVAGPGGHVQEAISLITDNRAEARTVARAEFDSLDKAARENLEKAVAWEVIGCMSVAADMLIRTHALLDDGDGEGITVEAVATLGAALCISGLVGPARDILHTPRDDGEEA